MAGVWAIAATGIAVIALVEARKDEPRSNSTRVSRELDRVQRRLDRSIADLRGRLGGLATTDDVKRLEGRLRDVEDEVRSASTDAKSANRKVSSLEGRVTDLENRQQANTSPGNGRGAAGK